MAEISRAQLKYQVERQREEIRTLNEVGKLLSSTTDLQQMIHLASSYLHQTFPVALCGILLMKQKKLFVNLFAPLTQMERSNTLRKIREAAGELLHRQISEEESVPVIEEPSGGGATSVQPTIGLRSHVFAPLTVNGQLTGILSLFSGRAGAFAKEDHHAIGIVAEQLGATLYNVGLVEELRRADQLKNQMLSIVSHELSTPLTAIKEGVNLVLEGALGQISAEQRDFLQTVSGNSDRLARLLEKVKTSTTLMTGQLALDVRQVDLRSLVANMEQAYLPLAQSRKVNFKIIQHPSPLFVEVDTNHLTIAINQLVENAIQATPETGLVTIRLEVRSDEIEIQVLDTGRGIAQDTLPSLFDRFQSLGEIHERKMGGLGLGLFIAKALIEAHDGSLIPKSTVGEGTLMTIHLPKHPQPAA